MRERELKLLVKRRRQLPPVTELLRGIGDGSVEQVDQEAVYFDTSDLRLTRAGTSLRYRSDDGWTVKLPDAVEGETYTRGEYRFGGPAGSPPPAAVELEFDDDADRRSADRLVRRLQRTSRRGDATPKVAAKAVARVQKVLGAHHDAVVAAAWLEGAATDLITGDRARFKVFAAGVLSGEMRVEQRQLRAEWPAAWRRARRRHRTL